jgi:predicted transcriptional regulator
MTHPFGDLLQQYRARKAGLSQTRLAELAGYDQAILVRMNRGKKDLTGPSGRERVLRLIAVWSLQTVLRTAWWTWQR